MQGFKTPVSFATQSGAIATRTALTKTQGLAECPQVIRQEPPGIQLVRKSLISRNLSSPPPFLGQMNNVLESADIG